MEFPRVLVVSSTRIGTQSATGVAMASLFAGWPKDRIAQLHSDHYSELDTSVCERYFQITSPAERLRRVPVLGRRIADRFGRNGRVAQWVNYGDALRWCRAFDPDVVYVRLVDQPAVFRWLPYALTVDLGRPVVTHIMDDWPARFALHAAPEEAAVMHARLRELFGRAAANLGISDNMCRDFAECYGVPFVPFHNAIDAEEWRGVTRRRSMESDGVFRLVYSGGLADDMCLQSAADLAAAVELLRGEGRNLTWDVFTAPWWRKAFRRRLAGHDGVQLAGFLPRAEYLQALADADLLLLPINFDERSLAYVRYSMSNKAPEYMAARTPVLAYGPMASATIEYAANAGWARVVSEQGVEHVAAALRTLMDDPAERARLAEAAHHVGVTRHDAAQNRERFRAVVASAATTPAKSPP